MNASVLFGFEKHEFRLDAAENAHERNPRDATRIKRRSSVVTGNNKTFEPTYRRRCRPVTDRV